MKLLRDCKIVGSKNLVTLNPNHIVSAAMLGQNTTVSTTQSLGPDDLGYYEIDLSYIKFVMRWEAALGDDTRELQKELLELRQALKAEQNRSIKSDMKVLASAFDHMADNESVAATLRVLATTASTEIHGIATLLKLRIADKSRASVERQVARAVGRLLGEIEHLERAVAAEREVRQATERELERVLGDGHKDRNKS